MPLQVKRSTLGSTIKGQKPGLSAAITPGLELRMSVEGDEAGLAGTTEAAGREVPIRIRLCEQKEKYRLPGMARTKSRISMEARTAAAETRVRQRLLYRRATVGATAV